MDVRFNLVLWDSAVLLQHFFEGTDFRRELSSVSDTVASHVEGNTAYAE